ncbi:MAG: type II toxin-antitoxin system Phd/YefM family antitoxin [Defluviitaleaceae bacterium]|nr:type II toxin-antitoxin system Phd/YefM family antitoxin [Defluviitaleaceae bacterium]
MIQVTATDFKINLGKYLTLVERENIHITKNGMDIAILVPPRSQASVIDEIMGVIPDDGFTVTQARAERRVLHENSN